MRMLRFFILSAGLSIGLFNTSASQAETLYFAFSQSDPPLSSSYEDEPIGLFPELVNLVLGMAPDLDVIQQAMPWSRAQLLVEKGKADGFMTYPSAARQEYALFTDAPVFNLDYGYLIFDRSNPKRSILEKSTGFEDLSELTVILENGVEWERDNIPSSLPNIQARNTETMMHLLMKRKSGDYFVMPVEMATHLAKRLGYMSRLAYTHVEFINDSDLPFHIGISKKHPNAESIIKKLNEILRSNSFLEKRKELIDAYRRP